MTFQEQIPRQETINLRERHVGPSCKLFFKADPVKIVRARLVRRATLFHKNIAKSVLLVSTYLQYIRTM